MTRPDEPARPDDLDDPDRSPTGALRLLIGLALTAALVGLWGWLSAPPHPVPADAPEARASGERARAVLERVAGPDTPHPAGSAAASAVRERLARELERLGLTPEVQETVVSHRGSTGRVRNLLARIGGREPSLPAALVVTHYDSAAAAPGVGDDLAGVAAVLEAVRALRAVDRPRRTLILLFTDAEEHNLGGAAAFARDHPWMAQVGCVLNFEGRGASGVSRLFEVGEGSGDLVRAYGRAARRPNGTSLAYEVYRRMPNDSDFTVFRQRGLPGLNFAFIGDLHAYHTPLDDLGRLDPRTLQHQTDQALAALWAVQDPELELGATSALGFADLFGRLLPVASRWELRAQALLALLAVLWGWMRFARRGAVRARAVLGGLVAVPLAVALGAGAGALFPLALDAAVGVPDAGAGHPELYWVGVVGLVLFTLAPAAELARRLAGTRGTALATWAGLAGAAACAALFLVGASTLFLLPATLAGLCALGVRPHGDVDARVGRITLWVLGALVLRWTPLVDGLMEAFHTRGALAAAVCVAVVAAGSLPLWTSAGARVRWGLASLALLASLVTFATLALASPRSPERPGRTNLVVSLDADSGPARVRRESFDEPVPAALEALCRESFDGVEAPAPTLTAGAARLLPDGRRVLRLHLEGGGPLADFWIERGPELVGARLDGEPIVGSLFGLGPEGYDLELTFAPARPDALAAEVAVGVHVVTPGLPEALAERLDAARGPHLVPSGRGDRTVVRRVVTFPLPVAGE